MSMSELSWFFIWSKHIFEKLVKNKWLNYLKKHVFLFHIIEVLNYCKIEFYDSKAKIIKHYKWFFSIFIYLIFEFNIDNL